MRPIVIGCNHKTAPLELREKMAFDAEAAKGVMDGLRAEFEGCEVVVLCTCNRSEIYVGRATHGRPRREDLLNFFSALCSIPRDELDPHTYIRDGRATLDHLFRVTCSLDSMVVGETQILNQVKQAMTNAQSHGACGKKLTTVFQWALHVAKEVHTETQISSGQVSVGSVAVQFARQIFSRLSDKTVLMIGAGEMGKLTLNHVMEMKPRRVILANRTLSRAERLAPRFSAEAVSLDVLEHALSAADVVITSTGASRPILNALQIEAVQKRRKYAPMLIIDIAIPRDVEVAVGGVNNIYLYNIDDLQSVAETGMEDRRARIAACDAIITQHVDEFLRWRDARSIGPLIQALRNRLVEIVNAESEWAKPKLSGNPHRDRDVIDQLLHRVVGKILHDPTRNLGAKVREGHVDVFAEALRSLFDLPFEYQLPEVPEPMDGPSESEQTPENGNPGT
jgi:glutamyl-tRNA reductase